jgi:DNA-directed RNA polymerase omega subunit
MSEDTVQETPEPTPVEAEEPFVASPPIDSRFLFVDVAAQRAKQLRRGALARLPELRGDSPVRPDRFFKLERVAMEEVSRGLIAYTLPDAAGQPKEQA